MKLMSYCFFDSAAGVYQRPFFLGADGEATRLFVDLVNEKDHAMNRHPNDYSIFRIGSFNDVSGRLEQDKLVECLMTGMQAIKYDAEISSVADLSNSTSAELG